MTTTTATSPLTVRPPRTRGDIVAELSRLAAEVERVAASFDTATFFAPQHEDGAPRWSPAEQVRHLTRATYPLARAFAMPRVMLLLRFGPSLRPARRYDDLVTRYSGLLESRPSAGRFAPGPEQAAQDDARRAEIMARFRDAISLLIAGIERWPERALDRYRLPHPLMGKLSARDMLFFTVFHTSHHGGQMARRRGAA